MSGALVDLVSKGIQDTYLTGSPDTTFFRQTYRRHTNFSMEPVRQVVEGQIAGGEWSEINISRSGDLLTDLYFLATATGNTQIRTPFDEAELYIGGQLIDTLTVAENTACAQLFRPTFSSSALTPYFSAWNKGSTSLQFFFGRSYGSALPLIALQYHNVSIRVKWRAGVATDHFLVYADYIQLDEKERNSFASKPYLMLIEQHQRVPLTRVEGGTTENYTTLQFNHPVKAVYGQTMDKDDNMVLPEDCQMKLTFNGADRLPYLPNYNYYQDHQFGKHTEHSATSFGPIYSFAMYCNRLVPTGSCNFSRIGNIRLYIRGGTPAATDTGSFYALNWNFLKLEDGMAGILFAN